jgi:hypothetical protein
MHESQRRTSGSPRRWLEVMVPPLRRRRGSFGRLGRAGRGAAPVISGRGARLWEFPGVTAAAAFATPGAPHAPSLWWPTDRAWLVGGDVDLDSTLWEAARH